MALEVAITAAVPHTKIPGTFTRTLTVGDRAVEILQTTSNEAAAKWIRLLRRDYRKHMSELVVGVATHRFESNWSTHRFNLLVLCVGSTCLFFDTWFYKPMPGRSGKSFPKELREFCEQAGVRFVGDGLPRTARMMVEEAEFKLGEVVDLKELVEKAVGRKKTKEESMDAVTKAVWGGHVDLTKPKLVVRGGVWSNGAVRNLVFDAFLASEVGQKVLLGR